MPPTHSARYASTPRRDLVVIDASAGGEIVCATRRGWALARLLPVEAEAWVPEPFYSEVLGATVVHQDHVSHAVGPALGADHGEDFAQGATV